MTRFADALAHGLTIAGWTVLIMVALDLVGGDLDSVRVLAFGAFLSGVGTAVYVGLISRAVWR